MLWFVMGTHNIIPELTKPGLYIFVPFQSAKYLNSFLTEPKKFQTSSLLLFCARLVPIWVSCFNIAN